MKTTTLICLLAASLATPALACPGMGDGPARGAGADTNKDGFVSREEVAGHPFLQRNFSRIDSNSDGRLAPAELKQAREAGPLLHADSNGDGQISRQEASDFRPLLDRFAEVDSNKDGQLSRDELRAAHAARADGKRGRHGHHHHHD